jgi:hypothetical protein
MVERDTNTVLREEGELALLVARRSAYTLRMSITMFWSQHS